MTSPTIFRMTAATCALLVLAGTAHAQVLQPPAAPPGTVTLPLSEYDRLVDRAANPPAPLAVAPLAAVVGRAELRLRASATDLRGTMTLRGEVLRQGGTKVPLFSGGTLIDAQQAGTPVPVISDGRVTSAVLTGPGPFTLVLTWATDVVSEPGRAVASLPVVRAGTMQAVIDTPGEGADVRVDGGLLVSRASSAGRTVVDVTLEPGAVSRVSWASREHAAAPSREVRLTTDVKTLITVAEADVRLAALFDVAVIDGQPGQFVLRLPDGFEVVSVSGGSVETAGRQGSRLSLAVHDGAARRHQFLLTLERTFPAGVQQLAVSLPAIDGSQRETGEVAWESVGTVELTAVEKGALRRLDTTEVSAPLLSLARSPLLSAFRYQRRGDDLVEVQFDTRRFPDAAVVSAIAERAVVTTLMTGEGRLLTEFSLTLRNRGQLFLKVGLPRDATLLAAEVGGEPVKPVEGSDGVRVPLVRPGFNPPGAYEVAFVYVTSTAALAKKGDAQVGLARVDVPIGMLEWELFLPDRYQVKRFEGDAVPREMMMPAVIADTRDIGAGARSGVVAGARQPAGSLDRLTVLDSTHVGGQVVDSSGAVIPGATVTVTQDQFRERAVTDQSGTFVVSAVPPGPYAITVELQGFKTTTARFSTGTRRPVTLTLDIAGLAEAVAVTGETAVVERDRSRQKRADLVEQTGASPSANVLNLQRRVSGVLPVRIDVPRAGRSYLFVRPLVLDEETMLRFAYRTR